ncbi:dihydrodipicolinate synthase family protein [bacterium]|nr:dihydrodipicolinate synthase family protein [bacterium]
MSSQKMKTHVQVNLSGLIVPLTTPFDDRGTINQIALIEHLGFLADHGIQRILVAGTTGEFFSLLPEERRQLLGLSRRYFQGAVLFQAGTESLALTLEQIRWAEDFGADAVLTLPPYYYAGATHQGLIQYFHEVDKNIGLPLILYNFPKHTSLPFTPELLSVISHFGLKDSSADLDLIPATPHYYLGGDAHILRAFQKGAYGLVSARANAYPELYIKMEQACKDADWDHARDLQGQINRIIKTICSPGQIKKVKQAVRSVLNNYPSRVRLPLLS